jgi:hypothetical protein
LRLKLRRPNRLSSSEPPLVLRLACLGIGCHDFCSLTASTSAVSASANFGTSSRLTVIPFLVGAHLVVIAGREDSDVCKLLAPEGLQVRPDFVEAVFHEGVHDVHLVGRARLRTGGGCATCCGIAHLSSFRFEVSTVELVGSLSGIKKGARGRPKSDSRTSMF